MGKSFFWFDATTCGPSGARSVHHMMHRQHLFFFLISFVLAAHCAVWLFTALLTSLCGNFCLAIYNEISSTSLVQTTNVKTVKLNFFIQIAIQ